jgi:hypothetical protein
LEKGQKLAVITELFVKLGDNSILWLFSQIR